MPYKDKDKQREAVRIATEKYRSRKKVESDNLKQKLQFYETTYGIFSYEVT